MAGPISLRERGNEAFKLGNYEHAHSYYTQAVGKTNLKDSEKAVLYKNRAACFLKMEKYQEAVNDATKALDFAPQDVKALYRRCQAYEQLGKYDEAYEDVVLLKKLDPHNKAVMTLFNKLENVVEAMMNDSLIQTELKILSNDDGDYFSIKTSIPGEDTILMNESLIPIQRNAKDEVADDRQGDVDTDDGHTDSCNQKDEDNLFYDETQLAKGEGDLQRHYNSCEKKSGHPNFIPVNDFNMSHLHSYHDSDHLELIKAAADLTVKIEVTMTSTERPDFWPNTCAPYSCCDFRGKNVFRSGTGMVWEVNKWGDEYNTGTDVKNCECQKCQLSDTPRKVCGRLRVLTARHVVFDDEEAEHTTCRFFFDEKDSPRVTLDGWWVDEISTEEDRCELECLTCDMDLLDKLDKMGRQWQDLSEKVNRKCMSSRDESKWTFMVSHPHGCPKQVSVGKWLERYVMENYRCKYTYSNSTCPGSSGACVQSLGYHHYYHVLHVHSGVNSDDANGSGTGWGLSNTPENQESDDYNVRPLRFRKPDGSIEILNWNMAY